MIEQTDQTPSTPNDERRNPWYHWIVRGTVVVVLLVGGVGGYLYFQSGRHTPVPENRPQAPAAPLEVDMVTLESRTVPVTPRFLGQTEASRVVEIRARVKGFLTERLFEEGQRVKQGEVLFRIDPQPFQVERDSAKAGLASAQARLEQARQQLARYQELFARGSVAPTELEQWQTEERVAAALVQQESARLAKAELDLGYTTIVSPLTGVIGRALRDVGSYVDDSASNGLLAVVSQVDPIYARFAVSEQETLRWRSLRTAGRVTIPEVEAIDLAITLADGTPYSHHGKIKFVDVQVDPSTGTMVVRGTIPNPDDTIKPGQYVHVEVHGIQYIDALLVPQRAIMQSPAGPIVYVVNAQGSAERRGITLGTWIGDQVIVESGVRSGERLAADRLLQIRPGQPLVPAPPPPPKGSAPAAAPAQGGR